MNKKLQSLFTLLLIVASLAACTSLQTQQAPILTLTSTPEQPTAMPAQPSVTATSTPVPPTPTLPAAQAIENPGLLQGAGVYQFTEGPAADTNGNIYFSDVNSGIIYRWSPDGKVEIFKDGLKGPNGLAFDQNGDLIVCEGGNGRLISIDSQGAITIIAAEYHQVRFNEPNDLWIDPLGGIYFTDPAYQSAVVQDGEHVYYITPDRKSVTRVISDLVRPNGIAGSADGKTLYVADHGAGETYAYDINPGDGSLSNKHLAVSSGSDGITLDAAGNLYLTIPDEVRIYNAAGTLLKAIPLPENPTNLAFTSGEEQTLFITARSAIYILQLSGLSSGSTQASSSESAFTLTSSAIGADGLLPMEFTCDGESASLPLSWSGTPAGTQSFALLMDHIAGPEDIHWYWILHNIPSTTTSLDRNSTRVGIFGNNSVNQQTAYAPPCSKGPGPKVYTLTLFALSGQPQFSVPAEQVDRAVFLQAVQNMTLDHAELSVTYSRK